MTTTPLRVGIVGTGWRAEYFARIAVALPDRFELVGVTSRTPENRERFARSWRTRPFDSVGDLVGAGRPELVITSVPVPANPDVIGDLVDLGAHVLAETPPAPTLAGLVDLWDRVGAGGLVHIAEQYPELPGHAARRAVVASGAIGDVSSVQVSSTHGYHAVALMRSFLGYAGHGAVTVRASTFDAPLVDPLSRAGWSHDDRPKRARTILATLDFGDDRSGLYDFTDNQWHNRLRFRRILVRGSRGEISGDAVVRLAGDETVLTSSISRSQLGHDLNLDGHDTEHLAFDGSIVWRNPVLGARFMDEEIAMAAVMLRAGTWARGEGDGPYSLADASRDHAIALAIDEAAETGAATVESDLPWA
ncbi:Gfo/Idh/MocA family oxidoreductase [Labedella phragmitis]|uniref:Gfo/Idh/MocA family oxidoreductase n=1 Tax=Labedella phragmitis TaxID=2498849 RepID=A0A3S5CEY3_9MICO|nr:Gfo/Idh/MocA family oxidoreductase [Labedella phragmitis]RWZ51873.1 Gfo/Idh/MocA family oxidoreductase [Labedella phragmitis]